MPPTKSHTMDYPALKAVVRELAPALEESRLSKAVAAGPLDVVLMFDTSSTTLNLLISTDPKYSRMHLVDTNQIPKDAPKLHICNMLNERDKGVRLDSMELVEWERIVRFSFVARDADGALCTDILVAELMGKYSNIILLDGDAMIIGSLKAVHAHMSSRRQVRPGLAYQLPPPEDKMAPREFTLTEFAAIFRDAAPDDTVASLLVKTFKAMSPSWARRMAGCAGVEPNTTIEHLTREHIAGIHRSFLRTLSDIQSGHPLDIEIHAGKFSVNIAYASFYTTLASQEQLERRRGQLLKIIRDMRKSAEKLLSQLKEDLASSEKRDDLKRRADAVFAAAHDIPKGAKKIELTDIHSPDGAKITVELDPAIAPTKLAAKWYERYNKLKRGEAKTRKHLKQTNEKIAVLKSAEDEAHAAADAVALDAAASRLVAAGVEVRFDQAGRVTSRPSAKTFKVHRYRSSDGFEILVGGNQAANDYLTHRLADAEDVWMHAQQIPGSHVIIRANKKAVPMSTLTEAAILAAWHSDGREGSKVPVDYTKVKYVHKPPGAKAGYVTYKKQRTIRIDPDERRVYKLKIKEDIK